MVLYHQLLQLFAWVLSNKQKPSKPYKPKNHIKVLYHQIVATAVCLVTLKLAKP